MNVELTAIVVIGERPNYPSVNNVVVVIHCDSGMARAMGIGLDEDSMSNGMIEIMGRI